MKLNILYALLCLVGTYEYAQTMDFFTKDQHLKLELDRDLVIQKYKTQNPEIFRLSINTCLGTTFTEAISIMPEDILLLKKSFNEALTHKKKQKVTYRFRSEDQKEMIPFRAAIKYKNNGFSVDIKELVPIIYSEK